MTREEEKQLLEEELRKKCKNKSKFYFSELSNILQEKPREAKKVVTEMVNEGKLSLWTSGSTSMYTLPEIQEGY
jgi:hypothetical protein